MSNINLLYIELAICLITLIIIYKHSKIVGLYAYSIALFTISNIMSLKTIPLQNFDINLGIIPFVTVFIASNIIIQKKGPEEVKKFILAIIASSIISYFFLYSAKLLDSSNINLFTNISYNNIFDGSERIYFANIVTMLYALIFNYKLYYYLKRIKNKIWISNLFSSIIINFITAILFPVLAYALIEEPIDIIKLIIIRYLISLIVAIIGTIPIYIANKIETK